MRTKPGWHCVRRSRAAGASPPCRRRARAFFGIYAMTSSGEHGWVPRQWRFHPDTLELSTEAGGYDYRIDLEECDSCAEILDWIAQIAQKAWATQELVGELVYAFDTLFDL